MEHVCENIMGYDLMIMTSDAWYDMCKVFCIIQLRLTLAAHLI